MRFSCLHLHDDFPFDAGPLSDSSGPYARRQPGCGAAIGLSSTPPLQVLAISERQQDAYQAEQDRKDRLAKARKRDQMMAALANSPLEVRCHLPRGGGKLAPPKRVH